MIRAWFRRRDQRRRGRELDERLFAEGFVRFGAFDGSYRRSMWARMTRADGAHMTDLPFKEQVLDPVHMIEIRLDKDGEDRFLPVTRGDSAFPFIEQLVLTGMYCLEDAEDGQRRL